MADLNSTNIYGYLKVHEDVTFNSDFLVVGEITARKISLTQPNDGFDTEGITSTPPMTVVSRGWVENLNVDYLDNHHGDYYLDLTNATNYLSDDRLAVDTISLNKLKYIPSGTILGRELNTTTGSVNALDKIAAKPILDLIGTNRGDQAVFNKINIVSNDGTITEGPQAVAPLSYDEALATNPDATLETIMNNKDILSFKMGNQVTISNVPTDQVENCISIEVGLTLQDGLLKGSISQLSPTGLYSPYTEQQNKLSLDTSDKVPYCLDRLNINAELYASNIYVTDLIMEAESDNWVPNSDMYSQVLTTKKLTTQINDTYVFAFFSPQNVNKFGYEVGHDIVKSLITLDDNQYTSNNILTAKKISDDFVTFRETYVDSRIYGAVGDIDTLQSLNANNLEDGVIILVMSEGLYRLSKLETEYTEADGINIVDIPNLQNAKWIKIADKIAYHNTTGNLQGGSAELDEYYHITSEQHEALHAPDSDNQMITSGLGMDFVSGSDDVTISLGEPAAITARSTSELTTTGHSHIAELYELDAVKPIHITEGAKVFGNKSIISIDIAEEDRYGTVKISNKYDYVSDTTAASSTALKDGLASVVNVPSNGTTVIGYVPAWETDANIRRLTTGYAVTGDYESFKNASIEELQNTLARADILRNYVDNLIEDQSIFTYKGTIDCSGNPNYPAAGAGDTYIVSIGGKIGGENGRPVEPGDMIICGTPRDDNETENAGSQEDVGSNWSIVQTNIHGAVVNNTGGIADNFPIFNGSTGRIIKDSGYNFDTFQLHTLTLDNLSALSMTGITCYNATDKTWVARSIVTEPVGNTQGLTIANANGLSGDILIKHADTSNQNSLIGSTPLTWINSIELDDYGHITKTTATVHPTTTAKTVDFKAEGLASMPTSGITVIDTLNIVNDTDCHVTSLSSTSKYLPIATTSSNGILTNSDWNIFNDKLDGPETSTDGNVPTWNGISGKYLNDGYKVENNELNDTTINGNTLVTTNLLYKYTDNRFNYLGVIDCSTNPNYPTGVIGDLYIVLGSGLIGGPNGNAVYDGDMILCVNDDSIGEAANWKIYRQQTIKHKKIITAIGGESTLNFSDIAIGLNIYEFELYRNGVRLLEATDGSSYDYTLDKVNKTVTLTEAAESDEKYLFIVEV